MAAIDERPVTTDVRVTTPRGTYRVTLSSDTPCVSCAELPWPDGAPGARTAAHPGGPDPLTPERLLWGIATGAYLGAMVNRGSVRHAAKYQEPQRGFTLPVLRELLATVERLVEYGGPERLVADRRLAARQLRAAIAAWPAGKRT